MREERTEIEISASSEQVWQILIDFGAFSEWNPFIRRASGQPATGERLEVFIEPPGGKGMTFRPTVVKAEPGRELRWLGRLFIPGLFDGEHYFIIESMSEGRVRFIHGEIFRGMLVPLLGGTITKAAQGFEEMNRALKDRAEAS